MNKNEINDKIYNFVLKKRKPVFHIIVFFLTGGIWLFFYYAIKFSYWYNKMAKNNIVISENKKIINKIDYSTVEALKRDGKFRNRYKRYLVKVTSHGESCDSCKKWEGKILIDNLFSNGKPDGKHILLSEAVKQGLFHNGCRHGLTTYYPELENITDYNLNPYTNSVPYNIYANSYTDRKTKYTSKNYVVFDTETTGLDPCIDKIIEISAIKFIDNKKIGEFSCLVNPNMEFDPFITKLTGIRQSDLNDKPTIDKVLPKFYEFIGDLTLVAHNAPFDIKMLACECYRNNIKLCDNKIIDTVTLAKRIIPKEKINDYKLTTLKEYLGLNFKSHRALDDCETCAKVYQLYLASIQKKQIVILDKETGEIIDELN